MPTNDFLPFASAGGANVMSQSDYNALAARLSGFTAGVATSAQLNKAWRQSSLVAAMIGQFIANRAARDALDDGNIANLLAAFETAVRSQALNYIATAGGTANARTVTLDPAPTSYAELLPGCLIIGIPATNTAAATLNINGLGAIPIVRNDDSSALAGGELPPFAEFWIIGGNARLLNPLASSVTGVGGYQTIVASSNTSLTLNNVAVATPWASAASASVFGTISGSVFTFTKAGRYLVTGRMQISVTGTPTGQFAAALGSIVKNNGTGGQITVCTFGDNLTLIGSTATTSYITGSGAIDAVPGDTLILTGLEAISSGGSFTSGNIATASMTILRTQ